MAEIKEFVPAVFANRFSISLNPLVTKVTFSEQTQAGEEIPHTAVVMVTQDAINLAKLLLQLAEQNRSQTSPAGPAYKIN